MDNKNKISNIQILFAIAGILFSSGVVSFALSNDVFAQTNSSEGQPNINAESIFNTKTMTLGDNIKNLVILIPNEGHHAAGEDNEARFLDQHFVPENAIVNTGTTVQWFNGDAGHERAIDVKDASGNTVFNTGEIIDSQASPPFTFSNPGVFNYEAEGDPGVTMTGSVTVGNIQPPVTTSSSSDAATTSNSSNIDTVGILMIPTQDIGEYITQITGAGITVDNTYDFKDLRGGQEGTGDTQTLIVWTTGGKDLGQTLSSLSGLSSELPYS
ncbi:cupredoxin domain-containing protein [Candidatus Nitrosocosmicus sp. T]